MGDPPLARAWARDLSRVLEVLEERELKRIYARGGAEIPVSTPLDWVGGGASRVTGHGLPRRLSPQAHRSLDNNLCEQQVRDIALGRKLGGGWPADRMGELLPHAWTAPAPPNSSPTLTPAS